MTFGTAAESTEIRTTVVILPTDDMWPTNASSLRVPLP